MKTSRNGISVMGLSAALACATLLQACASSDEKTSRAAGPAVPVSVISGPGGETATAQVTRRYQCDNHKSLDITFMDPQSNGIYEKVAIPLEGRTMVLEAVGDPFDQRYAGSQGDGIYRWAFDGQAYHLTVQAPDRTAKEVDVFKNCLSQAG